jgi:hypothetical protein
MHQGLEHEALSNERTCEFTPLMPRNHDTRFVDDPPTLSRAVIWLSACQVPALETAAGIPRCNHVFECHSYWIVP